MNAEQQALWDKCDSKGKRFQSLYLKYKEKNVSRADKYKQLAKEQFDFAMNLERVCRNDQ